MPDSLLLVVLLVALAAGAIVLTVASLIKPERSRMVANLHRGERAVVVDAPEASRSTLGSLAQRLTPAPLISLLTRQHARAGRPAQWPVERLLTLKLVWLPVGIALLCLLAAVQAPPILTLLIGIAAIVIYFLPELLLVSRGQERDQRIQRQLADTLDQMMIAVEAGLGFDGAMSRAAANGTGALSEELTRTLQDMRMGRSRREAFTDLADRNQVVDLRRFVRAILQADAYGISVSDVLRSQADEMRLKRRQRAEEKAQQVPVKVLMPLMLCILPVLFIVVMTPAVLQMMETFGSL
ncbi:type II secretion system F family protein [Agrococcus sp. ARC_14]|uniref:type II secretion system F family protein n=1 Tax=Agrococcus sp. ARC_14 TaxID=2919927 RepID=UPI001F0686B6|nr:type II secretion system F family protein [Agrococcus sp. ARC_14]MCH1883723.1 type II secretion system F family protein [Agrococcus sp. ARC_14]